MLWLPFAFASALFVALSDAVNKKYFSEKGFAFMALVRALAPVPFLVLGLALRFSPEEFLRGLVEALSNREFLKTVAVLFPLETLALLLYMEAIRSSDLSLCLPFLSFTPVFVVITGYLVLGESLSVKGTLGVVLVVLGGYILSSSEGGIGFLRPIRALLKERGPLYMFGVAFLYSITSVLGKKAVLLTDPVWFAGAYFLFFGVAVSVLLSSVFRVSVREAVSFDARGFFLLGLFQATMMFSHMKAISLAPAAYMIAVKRTSVLFGVLFGWLFFKERNIPLRLFATSVMVLGVILISVG